MKNISTNLSNKISITMFLATLLVVVRHSINIHVYYPDIYSTGYRDVNSFIQIFINGFTDLAVPFFFIISGYLFFYDFEISDTLKKWKKRGISLLIPYLIWNVLLIIFFLIIQNWDLVARFSNYDRIFLKISTLIPLISTNPIVGQFWYIRDLMIFILLAPLFHFLLRNKYIGLLLIVILLYLWKPVDTLIFSSEGVLFFSIGGFLGSQKIDLQIKVPKWCLFFILIFWICLKTFLILPIEKTEILFQIIEKLSIICGILFFWIFTDLLIIKWNSPQILKISTYAFFIYAFHTPLIKMLYKGMLHMLPQSQFAGLLVFIIAPIIVIIASILFARFLEKVTPRFYNILTGSRARRDFSMRTT